MKDLLAQAMQEIRELIDKASVAGFRDANCAALATADTNGHPSVRTIYLEKIEDTGIAFFANLHTGKSKQMQENPYVALSCFWPGLQYQVNLDGVVAILSEEDSDSYWSSRSRESALGAWATSADTDASQSKLREDLKSLKKEYSFEKVPRPENWRAHFIKPTRVEIWHTGWHRMSKRTRYLKSENGAWDVTEVNP